MTTGTRARSGWQVTWISGWVVHWDKNWNGRTDKLDVRMSDGHGPELVEGKQ